MAQTKGKSSEQDPNFAELGRNLLRMCLESGRAFSNLLDEENSKARFETAITDAVDVGQMAHDLVAAWMNDPSKLIEAQASLVTSYAELWSFSVRRMLGDEAEPVIEPEASDNRFKDAEWSASPYYDFWKQLYLINTRFVEDLLAQTQDLDPKTRQAIAFRMKLMTSALSPANFPLTSPAMLRETLATNGKNLVNGMRNVVGDMEKPGDVFNVSQTDVTAFEIGRNLATTKGSVVLQNDLFQLIQYAPRTDKVREVPLLIVPPWINKYYIFDLTPQKSFVKFAVDQGFTVFLMSWVNPDVRHTTKTFENYVTEGLFSAASAVTRETGIGRPNVLGYCIGGTMVASALAYLAALDEDRFKSATLLTTQLDFSAPGELSLFTTEAQLRVVEDLMAEAGGLDGSRMAAVFNAMRPRDLIWPYVVNNYLLGKSPPPFDLLYWNQDSTRMPAANHAFYLRQFYLENRLARGEMEFHVDPLRTDPSTREEHIVHYLKKLRGRNVPDLGDGRGVTLDLGKIRLPIYELAAREDHIVPAASAYRGAKLLGSEVEFVLAGSGHIAGVINPPDKNKYQYWTAPDKVCDTLEEWVAQAHEHKGSWWPHWAHWLAQHSGGWTSAREPGAKLGVIEEAPGSYVKVT